MPAKLGFVLLLPGDGAERSCWRDIKGASSITHPPTCPQPPDPRPTGLSVCPQTLLALMCLGQTCRVVKFLHFEGDKTFLFFPAKSSKEKKMERFPSKSWKQNHPFLGGPEASVYPQAADPAHSLLLISGTHPHVGLLPDPSRPAFRPQVPPSKPLPTGWAHACQLLEGRARPSQGMSPVVHTVDTCCMNEPAVLMEARAS